MSTSATTQPTASKEATPEQHGSVSQLISHLKSSFRPTEFERVTQLLTARDDAARKETCHWKAKCESMEKKHGEAALEKLMIEDELQKCKRERDLLTDQVASAETDRRLWMDRMEEDEKLRAARFRVEQKESGERERKWKEMYEKLREEFEEVKMEKAKLGCRVSALEFEKEKAEREAEEDKNLRIARLKEDQKESGERERKWKERYDKLWEDFEKAEKEKAKLGCRVSALEFEKEKAEREAEECNRRFEALNRRISRLEEDAALLMSTGPEERREVEGPVAETTDEICNELVMDGNEGGSNGEGSGNENVKEVLPVKESELNCGENAESLPHGGGSAPGTVEVGSSHRENGSMVIIEIDDSDDEMPTRKRGVCNDDDDDDIKPTKKRQAMMDLPDDSDSSDTGDSASSGSFIDSKREIARLNRKFASDKTWAFKADMMSALKREPELCMNAVCALYRKQLGKAESVSGSSFNINRGFNQFDALRGTSLGKYLTGGDPQGKLKRSVSELQEFDSNGLKDCQKFAFLYADQLYEIYEKKQDAFFLPS